MLHFQAYPDLATLTQTIAHKWLALITTEPGEYPLSFALAGGTTPAPIYRQIDLQFDRLLAAESNDAAPRTATRIAIDLIATDERWVPDSDPQSNEGLFRRCFSESAAHWNLISLKSDQADPASAIPAINARLQQQLNHPFTAVILGMGTDGHVASLFPNAPQWLSEDSSTNCIAALHPQSGQARMSLSFSRLLNTQRLWLIITGAEKRTVLEHATVESPIGALIASAHCDVEVFWCP